MADLEKERAIAAKLESYAQLKEELENEKARADAFENSEQVLQSMVDQGYLQRDGDGDYAPIQN